MKEGWKEVARDPENPELRILFERTANHIIKEALHIYSQLDQWLPNQKRFSQTDVEMIEQIDLLNEKITDVLLGGLITSKNFGAIPVNASLIKESKARELLEKNHWDVLDIQSELYKMDREELLKLVLSILEAADQGKEETEGYRLQRARKGLLALKDSENS